MYSQEIESIEKKVIQCIAETLSCDMEKLSPDTGPGDIVEWDSLGHVRVVTALEALFQEQIDLDVAIELETVEDFVEYFEESN